MFGGRFVCVSLTSEIPHPIVSHHAIVDIFHPPIAQIAETKDVHDRSLAQLRAHMEALSLQVQHYHVELLETMKA